VRREALGGRLQGDQEIDSPFEEPAQSEEKGGQGDVLGLNSQFKVLAHNAWFISYFSTASD
jgi:hypothetical protein